MVHGRNSACIDPEVKRSNSKPNRNLGLHSALRGNGWAHGMGLHVDTTAHFCSYVCTDTLW